MKTSRLMVILVALCTGLSGHALARGGGGMGGGMGGGPSAGKPAQSSQPGAPTRTEAERQTREESGKAAGETVRQRTEADNRERLENQGATSGNRARSQEQLQEQEQTRSRDRGHQPDQGVAGQQTQQRAKQNP